MVNGVTNKKGAGMYLLTKKDKERARIIRVARDIRAAGPVAGLAVVKGSPAGGDNQETNGSPAREFNGAINDCDGDKRHSQSLDCPAMIQAKPQYMDRLYAVFSGKCVHGANAAIHASHTARTRLKDEIEELAKVLENSHN